VKYFTLVVGDQGSIASAKNKLTTFMTPLTKAWNPNLTNFYHCKLEDLPSLLRVWAALWHNWLASYRVAEWCENSGSMQYFNVRYTCTLAPHVLLLIPYGINYWIFGKTCQSQALEDQSRALKVHIFA